MADVAATRITPAGEPEKVAAVIGAVRSKMEGLAKRTEAILDTLREVEDFLQSAALVAISQAF
jgi:hypothetical protein